MLATLKEVLEIANQRGTAIPHFNIDNIAGIEAVMEAADTENYPVILSIGQGADQRRKPLVSGRCRSAGRQ